LLIPRRIGIGYSGGHEPQHMKTQKPKKVTPLPLMKKKAQVAFNKRIRERDAGLPCLACGKHSDNMHASHYISQGSSSFLRYHPDNVHNCCAGCNLFKSGNLIEFRIGLLKKVGAEKVEWLEDNRHALMKWTREDLQAIISGTYVYEE